MNKDIENIKEKSKIDSEISIFWDKMSEHLPKSFERSALGDEKIFRALKQTYIEFRPLIADEVLKVVVEKIEEMPSSYVFNKEQKAMYFMTAKGIKDDIITLIKNSK